MSLSVVNFATGGQAASNGSAAAGAINTSTGNLLVVGLRITAADMSSVSSIKNSAGVAFTAIPGTLKAGNSTQVSQLWYMNNITGASGDVMTALFTASANAGICVWEISGADLTSPLDVGTGGVGTASTTVTSSSYTTQFANEIIVAIGCMAAINNTYSQQSGYALDSAKFPVAAGAQFCGAEHLVVSSIQTNITTSMSATLPGSNENISVATFQQASAPIGGGGSNASWLTVNLANSLRGLRH